MNLIQNSDEGVINTIIAETLAKYPDKVAEYKNGKKGILGLFMGEIMKQSKGTLDPKATTVLLEKALNQ
jgi:aspartyl-tRNA(Asn)/glutamyl-tRNA(Gln) amidotransferase subunit B